MASSQICSGLCSGGVSGAEEWTGGGGFHALCHQVFPSVSTASLGAILVSLSLPCALPGAQSRHPLIRTPQLREGIPDWHSGPAPTGCITEKCLPHAPCLLDRGALVEAGGRERGETGVEALSLLGSPTMDTAPCRQRFWHLGPHRWVHLGHLPPLSLQPKRWQPHPAY